MQIYHLWFYVQASPSASAMRKTEEGLQIEADSPTEAIALARQLLPDYEDQADFAKLYDPEGNEIAQIDRRLNAQGS